MSSSRAKILKKDPHSGSRTGRQRKYWIVTYISVVLGLAWLSSFGFDFDGNTVFVVDAGALQSQRSGIRSQHPSGSDIVDQLATSYSLRGSRGYGSGHSEVALTSKVATAQTENAQYRFPATGAWHARPTGNEHHASILVPSEADDTSLDGAPFTNAAVLVVAYNRPKYLMQTLNSLAKLTGLNEVTVYVSQDGFDPSVASVAKTAKRRGLGKPHTRGYEHWQRDRVPLLGPNQPGHAWLAQHYKWAIDKVFLERHHTHVIIAEDDMIFSPDFLMLFKQTAVLLEQDLNLWCISAWNDNGLKSHAHNPKRLFRTSYFPGLGWMMRNDLWMELRDNWPKEHWDHWMRLNTTSRGRECIVPEVNRNYNIGEQGTNMRSGTYSQYIKRMSFNEAEVKDFGDLSYLTESSYHLWLQTLISDATIWPWHEQGHVTVSSFHEWAVAELRTKGRQRPALALYRAENYELLAKVLDLWPYPRGHFKHALALEVQEFIVIVADERNCPFLPLQMRLKPSPHLTPVISEQGQDCNAACRNNGLTCSEPDFWFLNSCEVLSQHFPCEAGCALVIGEDIPNYVVEDSMNTYRKCLVTERQSTCAASHRATLRLCACTQS
jgi:alpha-1,3-mannosyl-glycoprotein beta-1,2-N-acetylglucosaminyltransferase